jgi:lysophospholipase L1-like esterase
MPKLRGLRRSMRLLVVTAVALAVAGGVAYAAIPNDAKVLIIVGTSKGDVLRGSAHADKIYGNAGNDRLYGYAGNDLLVGGPGADVLICGPGRDVAHADTSDTVKGCEVVKGLPKAPPPPPASPPPDDRGLYIALGTSISAGVGASSTAKSWVSLYFGYLSSNGSGVTRVWNLGQPAVTSDQIRRGQVSRAVELIDLPSDTLRVTIDAGSNDILNLPSCDRPNDSACPFAGNVRTILRTLKDALARDPGDETIQVLEYYNWEIGTGKEGENRARLLGDDLRVDCAATGPALGLNDLIHCIALEENAVPVDVLPAFDAGGPAFLDIDHLHPSNAGYLAIAKAFGGAVERAP